jgi:spermidine synthase
MALACTTNISSVLCIGMGVGIVPMEFARRGVQVEVVEINPAIVPVASNYFGFEPSRVQLHVGDGRHYLKRCTRQFDAVVLDAFLGDSSPSHLMTREAFAEIKRVLAPGGVLTINTFGELERGRDFFPASLHKTLRSVFKHVRLHSTGHGAVFFAAADHPLDQFLRPPDLENIHPEAEAEVQAAFRNLVDTDPDHGMVLTDDYNPVEFYDAHHREEIRRNLASAARSL